VLRPGPARYLRQPAPAPPHRAPIQICAPAGRTPRPVSGDTGRAAQLRAADTIIHTAACFGGSCQPGVNDPARLQQVHVDAVEHLLEAAADAEVPVMVHISSATTIGTRDGAQPSDEDTHRIGLGNNGYRASKIRAEPVIHG
jgi:nucleoside-diphosphate-sugar epimerase